MPVDECVLDKKAYQDYQEQYYTKQTISPKKKAEFNALLKRAINNELPEDDKKILEMYFFKNYTKTDIAKLYGVNKSTICKRINKSIIIYAVKALTKMYSTSSTAKMQRLRG